MKKLYSIVVMILLAVAASAQTSFTVSVPNVVSQDEQFNVTFTLDGSGKPSDFSWEVSDDFQLVWGPQTGRSTSIQVINGKTTKSSQYTYTYILLPKETGKFTLPAATVKVKGELLTSNTPIVEVVGNGASSSQSSGNNSTGNSGNNSSNSSSSSSSTSSSTGISDNDIFLKLTLDRNKVVVGEPVTATLKLYQRANIAGFEDAHFPSFNGFWSQEIAAPTNIEFHRESYNDMIYNVALLRKYILIPQKSGVLTIDPAELVCLVNVRVSNGSMNSIFDGFFDDYRTLRKRVTSPSCKVTVTPLPAGAPSSFGGGVGQFKISANVSRDSLKAHEAASLKITISGQGNVSLLEAPKLSFPPDFEVYDIKTTEKIDKNSGGTRGSKTYEYPFIPRSHGEFTIEPILYTYYDVKAHKYQTLQTEPIEIRVAKGEESESAGNSLIVSSGIDRKGVSNLNSDIRYINIKSPSLMSKGTFFVFSPLFWSLFALMIVLTVVLWLTLRKLAARRRDVVGARTRRAGKKATKRLKAAHDYLTKDVYGGFYEELHKAMIGFVTDKLNLNMTDLNTDNVAEILKNSGVHEDVVTRYMALIEACEFARYSPSTGHDAMQAHFDEAADVISIMDSSIRKVSNKKSSSLIAIIAISLMLPAVADAHAGEAYVDSLWNHAAQAYSEGNWDEAANTYIAVSNLGLESASLYCNIGSAYFKAGDYPHAILYFERALKLDPSYSDARYNLEVASSYVRDRIDEVPEFILKKWTRSFCYCLSSDSWAIIAIVLFAAFAALLLLFLLGHSKAGRQTGFFLGIIMFVMSITSLSFAAWQRNDYMTSDTAIVTRAVVNVKSSPSSEASTDLFVLHEGTKVTILDTVGEWTDISISDGRQGWLRTTDLEVI